ncbi:polysaccharide deacetylase family protein [Actinocorallia lasiicapitis]
MRTSRRGLLKGAGLAGGGLAAGVAGTLGVKHLAERNKAPVSAMAVPTAGAWRPASGHVDVVFAVDTAQKLVALTFDDGPMPNWTPMVHDILDETKVKATFMLVGERLAANAALIAGRMDRHEVGNHTWNHADLAMMTDEQAYRQFARAHEAFHRILGKEARIARPPFGHLGGTTVSAAGRMGYDLVLWSVKMLEKTFEKQPRQLVEYITNETVPGTILLAHDTGNPDRLVALNNLRPMIANLRAKGFEFVTVSELRAARPR